MKERLETGTVKLFADSEKNQREISKLLLDWVSTHFKIKGRFVDVGCADGWTIKYLNEKFGVRGVGITCDSVDIKECKKHGIKAYLGLARDMNLVDESLDFVYCRHTLEHSDAPLLALQEFKRVLKKGGYVILSVPEFCLKYLHAQSHKYILPFESWVKIIDVSGLNIVTTTTVVAFETEYCFLLRKKK